MTTIIKPKRSEVAASVPTTSDLSTGEIAINSTDGKMYIKDSGNVIREIGGAGEVIDKEYWIAYSSNTEWADKQSEVKTLYT